MENILNPKKNPRDVLGKYIPNKIFIAREIFFGSFQKIRLKPRKIGKISRKI